MPGTLSWEYCSENIALMFSAHTGPPGKWFYVLSHLDTQKPWQPGSKKLKFVADLAITHRKLVLWRHRM